MCEKVYSIDEIKKMLYEILKRADVKKAILFGSYAKNTQTATSDVNINFYGLLEEIVQKLQKNIDLFEITEIKKNSPIYQNIVKEGITIYEK